MTKTVNPVGMDTTTGQFEILQSGDIMTFPGNVQFNSTVPGIAAGAGAGGSPTIAIIGTDNGGTITLTPGIGGTSSAVVLTVTFAIAFPTDSAVSLSPANLSTGQLNGLAGVYISATASNFTINSTTTGLSSGTQFIWNYIVSGW